MGRNRARNRPDGPDSSQSVQPKAGRRGTGAIGTISSRTPLRTAHIELEPTARLEIVSMAAQSVARSSSDRHPRPVPRPAAPTGAATNRPALGASFGRQAAEPSGRLTNRVGVGLLSRAAALLARSRVVRRPERRNRADRTTRDRVDSGAAVELAPPPSSYSAATHDAARDRPPNWRCGNRPVLGASFQPSRRSSSVGASRVRVTVRPTTRQQPLEAGGVSTQSECPDYFARPIGGARPEKVGEPGTDLGQTEVTSAGGAAGDAGEIGEVANWVAWSSA